MTEMQKASTDDVNEAMKDVVDPELGINVVDLGLVYGVHVDEENIATLDMTLTSAACPLTDVIEEQTRAALTGGPGGGLVSDFRINWVWIPPWGPDKITDDGRDGEACLECGSEIERMEVGQRGTHVCPRCQPLRINAGRGTRSAGRSRRAAPRPAGYRR
jgi:metal-sulfur cluster biosynthetic enzyme